MNVLVDPTLLLTVRGQVWIGRAAASGVGEHVATSSALWRGLLNGDNQVLAAYRLPWFGWHRDPSDVRWLPQIDLIRADPIDETISRVQRLGPSGPVAADLWAGISDGHCLAARRPATLDMFVQAGIRLTVEGGEGYRRQLARIERTMHEDLVAALARRTRFLVLRAPDARRPSASVFDIGRGGFR